MSHQPTGFGPIWPLVTFGPSWVSQVHIVLPSLSTPSPRRLLLLQDCHRLQGAGRTFRDDGCDGCVCCPSQPCSDEIPESPALERPPLAVPPGRSPRCLLSPQGSLPQPPSLSFSTSARLQKLPLQAGHLEPGVTQLRAPIPPSDDTPQAVTFLGQLPTPRPSVLSAVPVLGAPLHGWRKCASERVGHPPADGPAAGRRGP